jgi:hypothetical protein
MKKIIVLLSAPFLIIGCKENSALSDVELTNPKLISPEIILSKHVNEFGRDETGLVVYLNDKNNNSIDLLKGGVDLNKTPLGVHGEMGGAPYYTLSNIELIPKRKYAFNIRLADDKSYPCFVNSPDRALTGLNVPEYHNINEPLMISWDKINPKNSQYSLEIKNNVASRHYSLRPSIVQGGKHIISANVLNELCGEGRTDLVLTLSSVTMGKTDPRFNGGSIKIKESISKQITLDIGNEPMGEQEELQVYVPK